MPDCKLLRCRACGAPIIWIKTENNKNMPCNPERVMYRTVRGGRKRIVTDSGKIEVSELVAEPAQADDEGYIPHWATCPNYKKQPKSLPFRGCARVSGQKDSLTLKLLPRKRIIG